MLFSVRGTLNSDEGYVPPFEIEVCKALFSELSRPLYWLLNSYFNDFQTEYASRYTKTKVFNTEIFAHGLTRIFNDFRNQDVVSHRFFFYSIE